MDRDAIEAGFAFEEEFSELTGAQLVPNSGAGWHATMDLESGSKIVWSLKSTQKSSFKLTKDMLAEVVRAVEGIDGRGGAFVPGMAIRIAGTDFCLLPLGATLEMLSAEVPAIQRESRAAEERAARARVPELLREDTQETA